MKTCFFLTFIWLQIYLRWFQQKFEKVQKILTFNSKDGNMFNIYVSFKDSALVQPGRDAPFGPASVVSSHQVQTHDDQLDKSSPQRALLQKLVSVSTWVSTILRRDFVEEFRLGRYILDAFVASSWMNSTW